MYGAGILAALAKITDLSRNQPLLPDMVRAAPFSGVTLPFVA
jgi:hypothetical protein